jgi:hypothetical protein
MRQRVCSVILGTILAMSSVAVGQQAEDVEGQRPCTFMVTATGGSRTLQGLCPNNYGGAWEITGVACRATTGTMTVLPQLTGGNRTSILAQPLTCGENRYAAVAAKGALKIMGTNGAQCTQGPCDLQLTIEAPAGAAPQDAVIVIRGQLTIGVKQKP